ncbi:MAG: bifunctional UDP-sugar hydrolase/5'-nucleotidase [Lachnospiraceae bacterium]|nr:bifunctional UDP-sugar hydrolase/5'-nucleotidase [Lachnospiraceae bacterium]
MKRNSKLFGAYIITAILAVVLSLSLTGCGRAGKAARSADIAVLYTGDVHCAVDENIGYAGLAAFQNELETQGAQVLLVDTGDAIQGGPIGSLTEGSLPIEIMNRMGYCVMALGNHEFDYGQEELHTLSEQAIFPFLSLNFVDEVSKKPIYQPYTIVERDGIKIAFVGVTTPKTITSSRPTYFVDENGNYKYSFLQDESGKALWDATQQIVDSAKEEGADYVIALAHLGIDAAATPYLSTELIANTSGIDVVLDGHSHSVVECERVQNKEGKRILLSSTGTGLTHIGYLLIDQDGNLSTGLVSDYTQKDTDVAIYIDGLKTEFEQQLKQSVATVKDDLVTDDPATSVRIVRSAETNLGNLCADAIRTAASTDVAIMNGGGIRAGIATGEITYGDVLNVFPFGNHLRTIEVTGQQLLDALELSVSMLPEENGGFLQVSGLTFTFHTDIPSPITQDDAGMFTGVDGNRRVQNVLVGGKPLELNKTYSLAGTDYTLRDGGDGYSMFADCPVLESDVELDFDALLNFLTDDYLENTDLYAQPYGDGRIVAIP